MDVRRIKEALAAITPAERSVFEMLLRGATAEEVAARHRRSVHTINNHTRAIFRTFGVTSRVQLVALFVPEWILDYLEVA